MKPALLTLLALGVFCGAAYAVWCVRWDRTVDGALGAHGRAP